MKIFIVGTKNSETPFKLAEHLKNADACYEIDDNEGEDIFVINYGRSNIDADLNSDLILNKVSQLSIMKEEGINVPEIYIISDKKKLKSLDYPKDMFPLMARKSKHSRGSDIIFLKTRLSMKKRRERLKNRDFLVQYIPKKAEYRVHVLGEKAINVCKKIHSPKAIEEGNYIHPHVWSKERGWTLQTIEEEGFEEIKELAIKAIDALGYDFGAVDLIQGEDDKYYVLEVNSAPRLNKTRRKLYVKYFRKKEKEMR